MNATMNATMKAAIITAYGGPEVLRIEEVETPRPQAGQILVKVHASGLNRADLLQRQGKYPPPKGAPEKIPGLEFAGEVAALGDGVTQWKVGDRVFGLTPGGAHAEFVAVNEGAATRIPDALDWITAGAIPEVFITAHDALRQAEFARGQRVLIHAVGSGVGVAAVQLARALGGVPYGTSRTAEKIARARALGLEAGLTTRDPLKDVADWGREVTNGEGFNVCLDLVGGDYPAATLPAMASKGRIVLIGTVAGGKLDLPLHQILARRLHLIGTILRARQPVEISQVIAAFAAAVVPLLAAGTVKLVIDKIFEFKDITAANAYQESNETFGKVVLKISTQ